MVPELLQPLHLQHGGVRPNNSIHPLLVHRHWVFGLRLLHRQVQVVRRYLDPKSDVIKLKNKLDEHNEEDMDMHIVREAKSFPGIGEVLQIWFRKNIEWIRKSSKSGTCIISACTQSLSQDALCTRPMLRKWSSPSCTRFSSPSPQSCTVASSWRPVESSST